MASAHAGSPWHRRWLSHPRQRCPGCVERVSTLLRDSLGCTPPPLIVRSQPGFRGPASPPMVRSLGAAERGFTPLQRFQGQYVLDLLPLSTHESPGLLATPSRSGLRPSFPARPICCSAFRRWSASLALPTAWPTMPSADFCAAVGSPLGFPSSETRNTTQTSPGKFDCLRRTPVGSTAMAFDGLWTSRLVARSSDQGCLISNFCSSGRGFARHCLQTPPRDDAPRFREGRLLCFANPSPSSGWTGTFTPKLSNMLGTRLNRFRGNLWRGEGLGSSGKQASCLEIEGPTTSPKTGAPHDREGHEPRYASD
jgi:hypothetical protein